MLGFRPFRFLRLALLALAVGCGLLGPPQAHARGDGSRETGDGRAAACSAGDSALAVSCPQLPSSVYRLSTPPAGYGVVPTGNLTASDLSVTDISTDPLIPAGALRIGAGSALAPAVAAVPFLAAPGATDLVLRMPSQGVAGIVFGWKAENDYWTFTVDGLTGLRRLQRVSPDVLGQPQKTLVATQTGSPVPANTWVTLSLAANPAMADVRYANMDLSAYGGFPAGAWGFYTEVPGAEFDRLTQYQTRTQPAALGGQYLSRGNARVVSSTAGTGTEATYATVATGGADDGKLALAGGTSGQGTTTVKAFQSELFRARFDLTRVGTANRAVVGLAALRLDEENFLELRIPHSATPGTANANRKVEARVRTGGVTQAMDLNPLVSGTGLMPTAIGADVLHIEVVSDSTGLTLKAERNAEGRADILFIPRSQLPTTLGGGLGLKGDTGTVYVDNLDLWSLDAANAETKELEDRFLTKDGRIEADPAYDPAGNRVFDGCLLCKFDAFNRITEVCRGWRDPNQPEDSTTHRRPIKAGATLAEYRYDALGRRIAMGGKPKTGELAWQHRYFDGQDLVEIRGGSRPAPGQVLSQFVHGPDGRVASVRGNIDPAANANLNPADPSKWKDYSYAWDAEGNAQGLYEAGTGALAERYEYDALGRRTIWRKTTWTNGLVTQTLNEQSQELVLGTPGIPTLVNGALNPFGWQGGEHDGASGLIHLQGKDYDPYTGLFIEKAMEGNWKDYALDRYELEKRASLMAMAYDRRMREDIAWAYYAIGGVQFVGGAIETLSIIGIPHGLDNMWAGIRTAATLEVQETYTYEAVHWGMLKADANEKWASRTALTVDLGLGFADAAGGIASVARGATRLSLSGGTRGAMVYGRASLRASVGPALKDARVLAGGGGMRSVLRTRWATTGRSSGMSEQLMAQRAEAAYAEIRAAGRGDIDVIASNTGLENAEVRSLKKHLFFKKRKLWNSRTGKMELRRFDADDEIAFAWQRAKQGPLDAGEQAWFRQLADHELEEMRLMDQGLPYRDLRSWKDGNWVSPSPFKGAHDLAPPPPDYGTFPGYYEKVLRKLIYQW